MAHAITTPQAAAITIQAAYRGHRARAGILRHPKYEQYNALCKQAILEGMSTALDGSTHVYLPSEPNESIVIKECPVRNRRLVLTGRERLHKMLELGKILRFQKSSHLTIPKGVCCNNFLIESRLPIRTNKFFNMDLYINHRELFDSAVREMVRMFSQVVLLDLISEDSIDPMTQIVGDTVRYDNLPLYIEQGKGKIGLIDLEQLYIFGGGISHKRRIADLARIFPYHASLIIEEAEKLELNIDLERIRQEVEKGTRFLDWAYKNHLAWLNQKGIIPLSHSKPFNLSIERREEIKTKVKAQAEEIYGKPIPNLGEDVDQIIATLNNILDPTSRHRVDGESLPRSPIDSDWKMIHYRSPMFKRLVFGDVENYVLRLALGELVRGDEICDFILKHRSGPFDLMIVKY